MIAALLYNMKEAQEHLLVALSQALPSDDQIIVGHLRDAERHLAIGRAVAAHLEQKS